MQRELAPHELILLAPSVVVPRSREDADSAAGSAPGSSMDLTWQHELRARRIAVTHSRLTHHDVPTGHGLPGTAMNQLDAQKI